MEILNYEGLLKYNEALHEDLLTNYASVLDINAVELDIEALKTDKVNVSDMMTPDSANGHAYVDLGLPSGTLWATMNVGASSETDYGNYYQYGKGAAQYQYAATSGDSNYSGTEDPLDSSVDTAVQVWGGSWHMPTKAQFEELIANTTYEWTTINGVNGEKFTAANGNYVFLPAAGNWDDGSHYDVGDYGGYWGSSPYGSGNAYSLFFSNSFKGAGLNDRKYGFSVRGVIDGPITPGSPKYATKEELNTVADTKQDVIDSSHKLSADLITDGTTNKVINVKPDWNAASDSDAEILNKPTNVSSFTNDANYVTQDTLDDILGVDVNGLTQIKEVLSDSDTTTGIINLIGLKADAADIQIITNQEIALLFDPYRGHEYVEIAGIKWATMNIGATSETDYGNYYQYGKGAAQYAETYTDINYSGEEDPLDLSVDTARQVWGGNWRMPTKAEFESLIANTDYTWETDFNGSSINGGKFTDKTDSSKYIFIPAAGYYSNGSLYGVDSGHVWSSKPDGEDAYCLEFYDGNKIVYSNYLYHGYPVRPVAD